MSSQSAADDEDLLLVPLPRLESDVHLSSRGRLIYVFPSLLRYCCRDSPMEGANFELEIMAK